MDIVTLLSEASMLPLPQAAVRYAAAGVLVFPCVPGEKRPLTAHGFHDTTTDPRQVRAWWVRSPMANIGIPTGAASGVEVVDVDRRPERSGFIPFEHARRAGITAGWAVLVRTPDEHAIVNRAEDFAQFVSDDVAARRRAEEAFYAK